MYIEMCQTQHTYVTCANTTYHALEHSDGCLQDAQRIAFDTQLPPLSLKMTLAGLSPSGKLVSGQQVVVIVSYYMHAHLQIFEG